MEESKPKYSKPRKKGLATTKMSNIKAIKNYSTIDHPAYVFYRDKTKIGTRQTVAHYVEYGKLISKFYEIVNEELAESQGGVYIKGLGYFTVMKYFKPAKFRIYKYPGKSNERLLTFLEDCYYIAFIPISKNVRRKLYVLDGAYTVKFKKKLMENMRKGYKWACNASLFYRDKRSTII